MVVLSVSVFKSWAKGHRLGWSGLSYSCSDLTAVVNSVCNSCQRQQVPVIDSPPRQNRATFLSVVCKICFRSTILTFSKLHSSACTFSKIRANPEIGWVTSQKTGENKLIVFLSVHCRVGLMMLLQCEHRGSMLNRWLSVREKNEGRIICLSKE